LAHAAGRAAETDRADGLRRPDHLLPDRRAARAGAALADREREAPAVAVSSLDAGDQGKENTMNGRKIWLAALAALIIAAPTLAAAQSKELFIPPLVYRPGPHAPPGIPLPAGFVPHFPPLHDPPHAPNPRH